MTPAPRIHQSASFHPALVAFAFVALTLATGVAAQSGDGKDVLVVRDVSAWGVVLARSPGSAVTDAAVRQKIVASGWPWRVKDKKSGIVLVLIPPGEFMMGSPDWEEGHHRSERQHARVIRKAFYLGETEVTQAQWELAMGANPSPHRRPNNPVDNVSWDDVQPFLQTTGLRLPSEAEWEYACRAGTMTPFSFGATLSTEQANYKGSYTYGSGRRGASRDETVAVGTLGKNAWGISDMHGNVYEWCQDLFGDYPATGGDERASESGGTRRLIRGGSWSWGPSACRAAQRTVKEPASSNGLVGFRAARTASGDIPLRALPATPVVAEAPVARESDDSQRAPSKPEVSARDVSAWGTVLTRSPGSAVTEAAVRQQIVASGWPWRVRDNKSGIVLVYVPPGEFEMGSPEGEKEHQANERQHPRVIQRGFYLGETEVTVGQWRAYAKATDYQTDGDRGVEFSRNKKGGYTLRGDVSAWDDTWVWDEKASWTNPFTNITDYRLNESHPVVMVSWNDAKALCDHYGFMLPSEAQFEYAQRAGSTTQYSWGDDEASGVKCANVFDESLRKRGSRFSSFFSFDDGSAFLAPVGSYDANRFGLRDMTGNVTEWCADGYNECYPDDGANESPVVGGATKVARGGHWYDNPIGSRVARRRHGELAARTAYVGFRVARAL